MSKIIGIIAGEPNSISSEIIFKSWKLKKNFSHKKFIIIGSINLLKLQMKKLNFKIKLNEINSSINLNNIKKDSINVLNVGYNQKKAFQKISTASNKYIKKCFDIALELIRKKKILGIINCPVAKESLFNKKHQGITEFLSKKSGVFGNEVMLIFNKKLSISPVTTHIPFIQIGRNISKNSIIEKVRTINKFYVKYFKKKPHIGILGLNPHNFSNLKFSEEEKIINPAIKIIKKMKIRVTGPVSPDTSFLVAQKYKFDVLVGMYHDQVLTPYKALFKYDAINVTLGLPYFRVSPDHGVANNIMGKNIANPKSLIESIKFFNYIN